jgi:DNA polymerase-1
MSEEVVPVPLMEFLEDEVRERVAKKEWMKDRTFKRAENIEEVMLYVDDAIQAGRCALDLETTGLSSRIKYVDGKKILANMIVGICLCFDPKFGLYIPLNHIEAAGQENQPSQYNLPEEQVLSEINRLCSNCITIYHNAKFDMAHLKNYGIIIESHKKFEDTLLLAYVYDSGQKDNKLKSLAPRLLNQPMIEYEEIAGSSAGRLELICPTIVCIYGASDAICTLDLYNYLIEQDIVKNQSIIYNLEKRVTFAVMEMERNLVKIDKDYLEGLKIKAEKRLKEIENDIYELAEHRFNIGSPQQIGKVLFDELGYKYPLNKKTASGQYVTDSATLEKISDVYPVVKKIVEFRALGKLLGTYINNLLKNCDENSCVKLNFKQTGTDTGRFSSPGGKGLEIDGYSGVNVQATPKEPSEENPDLDMRESFIAREGKTMVAIDYENEEMRVATNLSGETAWMAAIQKGIDFHTATAVLITGKKPEDILKSERKIAKTVNFLSLYLGGPLTLSKQAKVTLPEAKKILATFFAGVPRLKKWIDTEIIRARKRKIVKTVFGRTRLLSRFYGSGDRALESHGDRCSINTQIQGSSADIMKAVMSKLHNWITRNNLQDDIKILITMHDELVFEISTEKIELYVPEIAKIMMLKEIITNQLEWAVPLTVDIKYGDTWRVKNKFFEDFPETKKKLSEPLHEFVPVEKRVAPVPEKEMTATTEEPLRQAPVESQDTDRQSQDVPAEEEKDVSSQEETLTETQPIEQEPQDIVVDESVESNGYFIYELKDRREVTLRWLNNILSYLLEETNQIREDKRQILKIKDFEGNSLLVSEFKVHIKSFLILAKFHGI